MAPPIRLPPPPARPWCTRNVASSSRASLILFSFFVAACIFISITGNYLWLRGPASYTNIHSISMGGGGEVVNASAHRPRDGKKKQPPQPLHAFPGSLDCSNHGGPANELAADMIYWSDIPSDRAFKSPFYSNDTTKYLTFEPDFAGFNNMRMAFETITLLAHSMGRTLVMPPSEGVYWLHNKPFSFHDVYDIGKISSEHAGLDIITMEQFLKAEAMTGNLTNKDAGTVTYPPDNNRTNWNFPALAGGDMRILKEYLRSVAFTAENWQPGECLASFPNGTEPWHYPVMKYFLRNVTHNFGGPYPNWKEYFDNSRVQVNASSIERLREAIVGGYGGAIRRLCLYDENMVEKPILHFPCCKKEQRMLTHHYFFLYFMDWKHDLWSKRFVRDNLRYRDMIQCAAARVVNAVRQRARDRDNKSNPDGEYDSFHIRRGDLVKQYKNTGTSADEIYQNSKEELRGNATVFVATDHDDRDFFAPLTSKYDVVFLDDFKEELAGVDKLYYGMIDQLVASRGRVFFGCFQSTFSNFIFRIRAWRSQRDKLEGYENGTFDNSFYYIQPNKTYVYRQYSAMSSPTYMREWPVAWKNMDRGIGELGKDDA